MQQLPLVLAILAGLGVLAVAYRFVMKRREKARRRAYLRNRDARVRQQWADLEAMGDSEAPRRRSSSGRR